MPRSPFTCSPEHPYHLSARGNNRDWFAIPKQEVWDIMSSYLHFISKGYSVQIHAFVLMDNHFHLLASFPEANLSSAMLYFMRESSRLLREPNQRINHIFGNRVYRTRIESTHHFLNAYKYVLRNPVIAKLSTHPESYIFSTLHGLLGQSRLIIPTLDPFLFNNCEATLRWLNTESNPRHWQTIKAALRKSKFKLPLCRYTNRPHELEQSLL